MQTVRTPFVANSAEKLRFIASIAAQAGPMPPTRPAPSRAGSGVHAWPNCAERWRVRDLHEPLRVVDGKVYAYRHRGDAASLVRVDLASGAVEAEVPLAGWPAAVERVGGTLHLLTRGPQGAPDDRVELFYERVELADLGRTTLPLGVRPRTMSMVRGREIAELPVPTDWEGGPVALVGDRLVATGTGRLEFFELSSRRHLGAIAMPEGAGLLDGPVLVRRIVLEVGCRPLRSARSGRDLACAVGPTRIE